MEAAYDGRQIVGMDLRWRRPVLVRMTEDGTRPGTAKITSSVQPGPAAARDRAQLIVVAHERGLVTPGPRPS